MTPAEANRYRLTPDITVRGMMPSKRAYQESIDILRRAERAKRNNNAISYFSWKRGEPDDLEHDVWIALHQQGLLRSAPGSSGGSVLTKYGEIYLAQREEPQRDRSRSQRRSSASRTRRDNGSDSLARDYALAVHSILRNRYGFSRAEADGALSRWSQLLRTSWAANRNTGVVAREIKRYEEGEA